MFSIILGIIIVALLAYIVYDRFPPPFYTSSQPVAAYDNQFELFRDMEPETQTRENPWIGFLQEDTKNLGVGNIGEFIGNDSSSGTAWLYQINEPNIDETLVECTKFDDAFAASKDPWSFSEATRLMNLKNDCRKAEEAKAMGTLAKTYAYCNGCKCMDDTELRVSTPTPGVVPPPDMKERAFRSLEGRDNMYVCGRVIDGVKYACDPTCCNPTCR